MLTEKIKNAILKAGSLEYYVHKFAYQGLPPEEISLEDCTVNELIAINFVRNAVNSTSIQTLNAFSKMLTTQEERIKELEQAIQLDHKENGLDDDETLQDIARNIRTTLANQQLDTNILLTQLYKLKAEIVDSANTLKDLHYNAGVEEGIKIALNYIDLPDEQRLNICHSILRKEGLPSTPQEMLNIAQNEFIANQAKFDNKMQEHVFNSQDTDEYKEVERDLKALDVEDKKADLEADYAQYTKQEQKEILNKWLKNREIMPHYQAFMGIMNEQDTLEAINYFEPTKQDAEALECFLTNYEQFYLELPPTYTTPPLLTYNPSSTSKPKKTKQKCSSDPKVNGKDKGEIAKDKPKIPLFKMNLSPHQQKELCKLYDKYQKKRIGTKYLQKQTNKILENNNGNQNNK